jgi:hypothetical protein
MPKNQLSGDHVQRSGVATKSRMIPARDPAHVRVLTELETWMLS